AAPCRVETRWAKSRSTAGWNRRGLWLRPWPRAINQLSAARMFLFGARDVWFVVALPVFLAASLGWDHWQVGGFLAAWVIGYGVVQSLAPYVTGRRGGKVPDGRSALGWASVLAVVPAAMA